MFVRAVAQSRNDSQSNVRNGYGQGRVLTAAKALKATLADRVGTLDEVLLRLGVNRPGMSSPRDTRMLDAGEDYTSALAHRRRQLALAAAGIATPDDSPHPRRLSLRQAQLLMDKARLELGTGRKDCAAIPGGIDPGYRLALARRRRQLQQML